MVGGLYLMSTGGTVVEGLYLMSTEGTLEGVCI